MQLIAPVIADIGRQVCRRELRFVDSFKSGGAFFVSIDDEFASCGLVCDLNRFCVEPMPWEPPSHVRLAIAEWMINHGSDVHQGGDGPLMRAALNAYRIPMMELLVSHGADVNALWHGHFPIIFAPSSRWTLPLLNGFSITARVRTVVTMGTR
jgi:hypothetical protein